MRHDTQWHTAAPLWNLSLADSGVSPRRFRQPALLRFAGESFMDELAGLLTADPEALSGYVARPEQWDAEAVGWLDETDLSDEPPRLYQPVHNRFYLVTGSLVCRVPGLPDRLVDRTVDETASFVVRRIEPLVRGGAIDPADEASWIESAWIGDRQAGVWQETADRKALAAGEERHKLFAMSYEIDGQKRRLHAGLLPVAGREVYEEAAAARAAVGSDELGDDPRADPRLAEFHDRVVVALEELTEPAPGLTDVTAREALLFLLLDLGELLERDLAAVWESLGASAAGLTADELALRALLEPTPDHPAPPLVGTVTWSELLLDAAAHRPEIVTGELSLPPVLEAQALARATIQSAASNLLAHDLETTYDTALGPLPAVEPGPEADAEADATAAGSLYVVRLVYERPQCRGAQLPEVSAATTPFGLASFFDPDAPVRPVRIRLPIDTSVSGLRRFPKSASFLISTQLRKQIEKIQGLSVTQVEDGELNSPSGNIDFGVIWVLSIPIITICALILLTIIVQVLNIVFWWLPFFKIAIPIRLGSSE